MERVWLSTTYYLDPSVISLSADAERMFTRGLAYCGAAETRGFIPDSALTQLGNKRGSKPVRELTDAELWTKVDGGYCVRSWSHWQKNGEEILDRREADRERKRRQRASARDRFGSDSTANQPRTNREPTANQPRTNREKSSETPTDQCFAENESRDSHVTSRERIEENRKENSKEFSSSSHVSDAGEIEEMPRGKPVDVDGWKLVRAVVPAEHSQAAKTALAQEAGAMLKAGTPDEDVRATLELWLNKPGLGPRVLPHLLSDVIRSRGAPPGGGNLTAYGGAPALPPGVGKPTLKAMGWQAAGEELIRKRRESQQS